MTKPKTTYQTLSLAEKVFFAAYAAFFVVLLVLVQRMQFDGTPVSLYGKVMYLVSGCNLIAMLAIYVKHGKTANPHHNLIALGLAFTFVADTFLCFLDSFGSSLVIDSFGFGLFTVAEIVYAIYIGRSNEKLAFTVALWTVFSGVLFCVGMLDVNTILAIANLSVLTVNMVTAWPWLMREKTLYRWLFAIGLLLFFGCDYSIMFRTLLPEGTVAYAIARFLVWFCYIPSQYLLLMSYRFAVLDKKDAERTAA